MTPRTVSSLALCLAMPLLAACALANCGCLLVAAGTAVGAATGVAYVNGKISATYFAYPRDVWMATRQGLTELGMPLLKESFDGFNGSVESKTSDGDKVFITLECLSPAGTIDGAFTRLSIRIASFGDRKGSELIFQQIGSHVPTHMLPQSTNQGAMPGGAALGTNPVGAGVMPLTVTNGVNSPPLTIGNTLNAQPSEQPIIPMSGPTNPPPLADPAPVAAPNVPVLPLLPVPTEQPRGGGA
jgi:Protein of unknown function (DUF3568)